MSIHVHLRAAAFGREGKHVVFPDSAGRSGLGLLPPTACFQEVISTIPIHVAETQAVRESAPWSRRRDRLKRPRASRITWIKSSVAEAAVTHTDQDWRLRRGIASQKPVIRRQPDRKRRAAPMALP